ncbi:MAG: 30S ribosome-binding factor RbfA [Clostridia bacterium]|nr:30S ribosome-binding factor RbfA [Clostridia bacterium]
MANLRTEKLNAEFQRNIYDILKNKVKDPRLTEMFTVTSVVVDKELTYAKVLFSIYSTDEAKKATTFEAIKSSAGFVRQQLFKSMRIRCVPELAFFLDKGVDKDQRIDDIIKQIHEQDEKKTEPSNQE